MKNLAIILTFAILLMAPELSNAQLGNFIKNKASKALNAVAKDKAGEAADTAAQKKAENMGNTPSGDEKESGGNDQGGMDLGKLFGSKVDLKYKDEYHFTSRLYMVSETYDKKEVLKMDLFMFFSANSPSIGIETKSFTDAQGNTAPIASSMVMDGENKCFIILTDMGGVKMGMISAIPDENSMEQPDGKKGPKIHPTNFARTGNTRTIAGYTCDEYSYTDQENKSTGKVWFTRDADLRIDKRGWQQTGMGAYYGYEGFEGGIILANEAYDDKGKLIMKSETKEINPSFSHAITVKGYSLRQINMNQGQRKK